MKQTTGLSSLITSVLLIMLVVAAAGIVLYVLPNSINLSPAVSCTELQVKNTIVIEEACFDSRTSDVQVRVSRAFDSPELEELRFTLSDAERSRVFVAGPSCEACTLLEPGTSFTYSFSYQDQPTPETTLISVNNCAVASALITPCS